MLKRPSVVCIVSDLRSHKPSAHRSRRAKYLQSSKSARTLQSRLFTCNYDSTVSDTAKVLQRQTDHPFAF